MRRGLAVVQCVRYNERGMIEIFQQWLSLRGQLSIGLHVAPTWTKKPVYCRVPVHHEGQTTRRQRTAMLSA